MRLLHHLETQLERQIPAQLQTALQQALDDYQPLCDHCRLAMHRHHRYARAIATSYGEVRLQIPVFRCGQCRRMAGGMTLLGDEMRHQRFSKKTVTSPSAWPAQGLSYARAGNWVGLRQEYGRQVAGEGAFGRAGVAAGRSAGNGRPVDANP